TSAPAGKALSARITGAARAASSTALRSDVAFIVLTSHVASRSHMTGGNDSAGPRGVERDHAEDIGRRGPWLGPSNGATPPRSPSGLTRGPTIGLGARPCHDPGSRSR